MKKISTVMTDYSPNNYLSLTKDEKGDILVEFKQIQEEKKEKDIMDNRLHFYGQGSTPSCVRALRSLFMGVIQDINTDKNGEEYIQKNIRRVHRYGDNIGEHNQEVCIKAPNKNFEDKWFTNKYIGTLQVINSADIKLGVTSEIGLLFKHPNNGGKSPNTHKALLGLFNAMQEDSKKRSHISVEFRKKLKGNSY